MDDLRAPTVSNVPEYTVSEISGAVKRTLEGNFGRVRVRGEITELKRYPSGHIYFSLKDEGAKLAGVVWKTAGPRPRHGAGERGGSDRHRPHLRLWRALLLPAHRRADGICRRRRAAGAHRDAARPPRRRGPVRRRPQAQAAGAADGHRRGQQRARRGDPGHPHHARPPLSSHAAALAGAGAGRGRGRAHRRRHRRLRRAAGRRARCRGRTC